MWGEETRGMSDRSSLPGRMTFRKRVKYFSNEIGQPLIFETCRERRAALGTEIFRQNRVGRSVATVRPEFDEPTAYTIVCF